MQIDGHSLLIYNKCSILATKKKKKKKSHVPLEYAQRLQRQSVPKLAFPGGESSLVNHDKHILCLPSSPQLPPPK